jgi:hypothetical protein
VSIVVASSMGLVLDGIVVALEGRDVTSLARGRNRWLAVTERSVVHAINDRWDVTTLGTIPGIDAISEFGGQAMAGVEEARLMTAEGEPDAAFDGLPDRASWYTPWGGPPTVRSLDEGPDGLRWASVHVGGVLVGDGERWRATMDIDHDVHEVVAHPTRERTALCAAAVGLGWTTDAGLTWQWSTDGLHARYCRAVASHDDLVLVSVSRGAGGRDSALYRGRPGDALEPCEGVGRHAENIDTGWVAATAGLAAVVVPDGRVFASADHGETWDEAFTVDGPRGVRISGD